VALAVLVKAGGPLFNGRLSESIDGDKVRLGKQKRRGAENKTSVF
jgi:hypothetical protein